MFVRTFAGFTMALSVAGMASGHDVRRRAQLAANCPAAAPREGESCSPAMVHRTCRYELNDQHTRCSCVHPETNERPRWICRSTPVNPPSPAPPGPPTPPAPAR